MITKLRFLAFTVRWLWRNRTWKGTRQKYKALDRAWARYEQARQNTP